MSEHCSTSQELLKWPKFLGKLEEEVVTPEHFSQYFAPSRINVRFELNADSSQTFEP